MEQTIKVFFFPLWKKPHNLAFNKTEIYHDHSGIYDCIVMIIQIFSIFFRDTFYLHRKLAGKNPVR